jgi:hypothetical protein
MIEFGMSKAGLLFRLTFVYAVFDARNPFIESD